MTNISGADFAQYLQTNATARAGGKPIWVPGLYSTAGEIVWRPYDSARPISDAEVVVHEEKLGVKLPAGYHTFMQTVGAGQWANAFILHPSEVYAFESSCGAMAGWLLIAENVDGCGNGIAINPGDESGSIYYTCHDPYGYAITAPDFATWIEAITRCQLERPKDGTKIYYDSVSGFVEVQLTDEFEKQSKAKPWWQFW